MTWADWLLLIPIAAYCLYLLLRPKKGSCTGCCGDCAGCSGKGKTTCGDHKHE